MLVAGFPAPIIGTNCWIVAPSGGDECLVIDPGIGLTHAGTAGGDVDTLLTDLVAKHGVRPVAVLATHGHLDHTFSIRPISEKRGLPAYIHSADRELLGNPERAFGPTMGQMFAGMKFIEPSEVRELGDGDLIEIAGMQLQIDHAPGHTPGSILIRTEDLCFTGDVLFAGSIGRTDLPGGSITQMAESLRTKILPLDDDYRVFPGHGDPTTIGYERGNNEYLVAAREGRL